MGSVDSVEMHATVDSSLLQVACYWRMLIILDLDRRNIVRRCC